jgi:hypothetical protein
MASKLKNIGTKKVSVFYLKDGFYPKKKKKTSWSFDISRPFG